MTDTDRLAALLIEALDAEHGVPSDFAWHTRALAARLIAAGVTLAPTPPAALDVERLTAALVELEESKLCNACLSDSCEEHDEMPDTVIGCGDGPALAAIYAALAATLKGADRE